jgi:hypothetical protein
MTMVRISVFIAAALMLALTACTAITDFNMPGKGKYDLDTYIPAPITVTLAGDGTGSLTLDLTEPLPKPDSDNYEDLLVLLTDGTITLTVQNDTTAVSFDLTSGTRVTTAPAAAGEYALSLDETGALLTILFYNQTTDGSSLQSGQGYHALIDVLDNSYFVATAADTPITRVVQVN